MRIVLTGGGTGGHIYPAISVGQALREAAPGTELLFVGSSHGPEGNLAQEAGIPFKAVPSSPLTKSVSARNAVSLVRLAAGVVRARGILKGFQPDAVLGTGGYTTAAVLVAARSLRRKIVIHEQNAVPGRTNLWLARIADRVCVSFDDSAAFFPGDKVVVTGVPIRGEFQSLPERRAARRALGLSEDAFTILVVGGSQGARGLNNLVLDAWPHIEDDQTQVLHQVGRRNLDEVQSRGVPDTGMYHVEAYVEMPPAMASADLVICRSGASTIAEITASGLPSVLVPYPYAVTNEQKRNAEYLVKHQAAVMCEEGTADARMLAGVVTDLRSDAARLRAMAAASRSLARPDAAARVAEVLTDAAGTRTAANP